MSAFIGQHIKIPKAAQDAGVNGTVGLSVTINHLGEVVATKVISSLGYGCDEEADRVVKLLKFKVEKHPGLKVQFHKNIQIHFHSSPNVPAPAPLPVKQEQDTPSLQWQYTFQPTEEKQTTKGEAPGAYFYTIDL